MSIAASYVHRVGLFAIPHPDNDHRPFALRHRPLAVLSTLLLITKLLGVSAVLLTPRPAELSTITASRIVQLTNAERRKAGFNELTVNSALTSAALQKGTHMLEEDYFSHISPSGVTPWFWINKSGYKYTIAGENLAIDFTEAEDVVAAWLASPTHRDNMLLNQYEETGVAVVTGEFQGGTSTVVVHLFGQPTGSAGVKAAVTPSTTPMPTPRPSVTPTPVPATPLPADTTPPRVPRIALGQEGSAVSSAALLRIEAETGSYVHIVVNGKEETAIPATGERFSHQQALSSVSDGPLTIAAFSTDAAQNKSALSEALALTKDTTSPTIALHDVVAVLSPVTDSPMLSAHLAAGDYVRAFSGEAIRLAPETWATFPFPAEPLTFTVQDAAGNSSELPAVSFAPQFATDSTASTTATGAHLWRFSHYLAASIFASVLVLLAMAVFIRIRIQHVGLISHASLVLLAAIIFFML